MPAIAKQIGNRIKSARVAAGLSQRDVAELLGLSHVGFGDIERGKNQVSIEYLYRLSDILGKPVTFFLSLDTGLSKEEEELLFHFRRIRDENLRSMAFRSVQLAAEAQAEGNAGEQGEKKSLAP